MNYRSRLFSVLFILVTLSSSQLFAAALEFSKTVSDEQASILSSDLTMDWTLYPDEWVRNSVGLPNLTNDTILGYINSRVHYVIGEKESAAKNISVAQKNYGYQNPGIMPDFERPTPVKVPPIFKRRGLFGGIEGLDDQPDILGAGDQPGDHKPMVVMANVGTAFYYFGKQAGSLLSYHFDGKTKDLSLPVKSPYVGIIQIGEGLFKIRMNKQDDKAFANSVFRIATIFHEARHGDGNGKSLGFPHAICPAGTAFANVNACDRNGNGPYTAGAGFLKQARIQCLNNGKCSKRDAEILALAAVDSYSRVLDNKVLNATPEGI